MAIATVSNIGGNWSSTSAWVSNSVPINGDYVVFTSTSGNLLVDVSTANIGIDFSNYAATITFDNNINVRDYVSLGTGGYTQSGSFGLNINRTETILLSNGVTWSRTLTFTGVNAQSYTMSSNWINTGNVVFSTGTGHTLRSNNLFIKGNLIINTGGIIGGTTKFILSGDTTWSAPGGGSVRVPMDINSTGTVSISGSVIYATDTLRYITAATVSTTGSTLTIPNLSGTILDTAPIMWNNVNFASATLTSDLNMRGNLTNYLDTSITFTGVGRSVFIGGNLIQTNQIYGDATLVLNGTGSQTWSQNGGVTTYLRTNLTINKPSGNFIVSGIVRYIQAGNTINYISADDAITTGSTLQIEAGTTLNTSGMTWSNITLTGGSAIVLTLSSDLNISGTLTTQTSAVTINGSGRFVNLKGNLTTSVTTSGSATIVLLGTGSQTWTSTAYLLNSLRVDKPSGTLSLSSNTYYQTGTLSYISGTVSTTGNTLNIGNSCGLDTGGITWNNFICDMPNNVVSGAYPGGTVNLSSNLNINGNISIGSSTVGGGNTGLPIQTITFSTSNGSQVISSSSSNITIGVYSSSNGVAGSVLVNFPTNTSLSANNLTLRSGYKVASPNDIAFYTTVNNVNFNVGGTFSLLALTSTSIQTFFSGNSSSINMIGNGNMIHTGVSLNYITIPINLNSSGSYNISSTNASYPFQIRNTRLSYNSGTFSGVLWINGCNVDFNSNLRLNADAFLLGTIIHSRTSSLTNLTTTTSPVSISGTGSVNVGGNLTVNTTTTGTSSIILDGTSSQIWSATSYLNNNLSINKSSGTFSLVGNVYYQSGTFSFTSGNYSTTGSTLNLGTSCKIDSNGLIWNNVTNTTSAIINLPSDMNWTGTWSVTGGTLTFSGIGTLTASSTGNVLMNGSSTTFLKNDIQVVNATLGPATLNRNNINITGNLAVNGTTTGTSSLIIMGTTNQTWTSAAYLTNNLTINKISGTLSLSADTYYQSGTLSYISGSVSTTGNTLTLGGSTTLATNGIIWNNFIVNSGTIQLTLNNKLDIAGTTLFTGVNSTLTVTFAGIGLFNPTGGLVFGSSNIIGSGGQTITVTLPNDIFVTSIYIYGVLVNTGSHWRNVTLNGSKIISISGSFTSLLGNLSTFLTGTSTLRFTGSGSIAFTNLPGTISIPLEISSSGTYTFSGLPSFSNTTITYTSGKVAGVGCIFTSCTLNLNAGGVWDTDVTLRNNTLLVSNSNFSNLTTDTTSVAFSGAYTVNVKGNLAINIATSGSSTPIEINGTGSQTWTHGSAVYLSNNLSINKPSGTLNVSGNVYYQTGTMSYVSGTVSALNSTLNIGGSTNLQTNPIQWFNINNAAAAAVNLIDNLSFTGTWSANVGVISYTGSGLLTPTASSRINFSGSCAVTVPDSVLGLTMSLITLTTTGTTQLRGTISCSGLLTLGGGTIINNASGFTGFIKTGGGLSMTGNATGTATIILNGGTWSATGANYLSNNLRLDGNSTISSNVYYQAGTVSYVSGVVNTTNSTLNLGSSCVVDSNGLTWSNITNTTTATVTLPTDLLWIGTYSITAGTINFSGAGSLTASTTGNVSFSGTSTVNLKNNIQVVNATLGIVTINSASMSIVGNLIVSNTTSGNSTLIISGTSNQSWTHTSAVYLSTNLSINKQSGVLTLGASTYVNGLLNYISGTIDVTTNSNTLITQSGTFNTSLMTWNNFYFASTLGTWVLQSNLNVAKDFTLAGSGAISGNFDIYCANLLLNNSSTGGSVASVTKTGVVYCSNDFITSGASNTCSITGTVSVGRNCTYHSPLATIGANSIIMTGTGVLSITPLISNRNFLSDIYINTPGKITITGNYWPGSGGSARSMTINLIKGKVDARNATLTLSHGVTHYLTNMHKIAWGTVSVDTTAFNTLVMNEFFSGDPYTTTNISATTTTNYAVVFTDNFEKISRFVNVSGLSASRPNQLLVVTDNKRNSTNRGIRYINSMPNGFSKNLNLQQPQVGAFLLSDPAVRKF